MASTGKKEYTLKINGLSQNVKDVTKLEEAVNALDKSIAKVNEATVKGTAPAKAKAAALSEEEKAAKKLADTQKRLTQVDSAANKAQIEANAQLRERTREVTRSIQVNKLAEGSIAQMGMQLTDLRNNYEALSAAERADVETGGKMLEQIQALDAEYKALRESTGNFRDSVGNYEKGYKGLQDLTDKFELATRGSVGMATEVLGSNAALETLGNTTNLVARSTEGMAGILALASTASEAYNAVVKEGWIQQKAAAIIDGVRAVQLRARTAAEALATKGTIGATIAQKAFNLVAAANPYVLLAMALITVVGAIAIFASGTSKASEKQKEANELQAIYLDNLEREAGKLKEVGDARVRAAETNLAVLTASGAKIKDIRAAEDKLAAARLSNNAQQRGFYAEELANLDANKKKVEQLTEVLNQLKTAQAKGESKLKIDIDLDGKVEKVKIEDAINSVQGAIDNLGRKVNIAVGLKTDEEQIKADIAVQKAARIKGDKDLAKERAEKAKERTEKELEAVRAAEDARIALIVNGYEKQRRTINAQYDREIQDLKIRLATEKTLTTKARAAINETIKLLDKQRNKDLADLDKERADKAIESQRQLEDSRLALVMGQADRSRAEINIRYDRQVEDLKKRLETEKDLTKAQQDAITQMIVNAQDARGNELEALTAEQIQRRTSQELAGVEFSLNQAQAKIGDYVKRNKDGLKLIDVKATRANLAAANDALGQYIGGLTKYQDDLKKSHEATLATLKEGTPEYEDELQKYATANLDVTEKIKKAQKEQVDNTKASASAQIEYFKDLFGKISEYADAGVQAVTSVVDTLSMGLQAQLDDLNSQLDVINERYADAQKQREDAVANVESIEEQLQTATGGTADALKSQLADAMHARQEADREEKRLAKEKEKREAEIAKKEKQMKRLELVSQIAQGIANTAAGVTKALGLVFPLNLVVAGIVGAMGAVQVGIMAKQLTKLAKGGEINGPSHDNGGVRIHGTNIEVEGGEYVVNKDTTRKNKGLVSFINSQRKALTADDINNFFNKPAQAYEGGIKTYLADGGEIPTIENNVSTSIDYEELADAMGNIKIEPKVAVTDIMDATDQVTTVRDLSGF
jgi:hypothetical protein